MTQIGGVQSWCLTVTLQLLLGKYWFVLSDNIDYLAKQNSPQTPKVTDKLRVEKQHIIHKLAFSKESELNTMKYSFL